MPDENDIHQMYAEIEKQKRMRQFAMSQDPNPNLPKARQPMMVAPSRNTSPSFRSVFFNVGEGLMAINPGETRIVAKYTVPHHHAGVLTGFSQWFGGECEDTLINNIRWGLRIDGLVPQSFMDFVGQFSTLMFPHSVYFPLTGGADTLGSATVSIGGRSVENTPTVYFQATNLYKASIVVQGRLEGYTFPTAERNDQFGSI